MDQAVKQVVIVGGGTAGWLCAAVLNRAFGQSINVSLVESDDIGIVGVGEATIPTISYLCRYLGLDEHEVLSETQGTYKLGIEFVNWGKLGQTYGHWFGTAGHPLGLLPFHQYWIAQSLKGKSRAFADYSFNAKAAKAGLMGQMPQLPDSPLDGLVHAWHFDSGLFGQYLRKRCESLGVKRIEGLITEVSLNPDNGHIEGLRLKSGQTVAGDFFIDCSGFRGLLINEALNAPYTDWSQWLRVDRAYAVQTKNSGPIIPYTRATALGAGWQWRIPLQHRQGNGHVFSSPYIREDEGLKTLTQNLEAEMITEPRLIKFTTGHRSEFWVKNCVAVGLSSGFLEPLESTSIHMVQSAILRLLTVFPTTRAMPEALRARYNQQTRQEYEWIRDFIILHYKATDRDDTAFWRDCQAMSVPDSLAHKLEIFKANGLIATETDDLFRENSWIQVLLGQNVSPAHANPATALIEDQKISDFMAQIAQIQDRSLPKLMPHEAYLSRYCQAKAQ